MIELVPASGFSNAALAAAFTAGYEGYQFPIRIDEARFAEMATLSDFDLDRSRVAVRDGEPVGLVLIGVRGERAWIGGLGVAVSERRHGLGRRLMEAVLDRELQISLEVLEPNAGAIALYEALGFETTRLLEVWTLDTEGLALPDADVGAAREAIRALRGAPEPWQRADASLDHLDDLEAVAAGGGAAVFRRIGEAVLVLQVGAPDAAVAADLLRGARARGSTLRFVNVLEDEPSAEALRTLEGRLDVRQLEMAW